MSSFFRTSTERGTIATHRSPGKVSFRTPTVLATYRSFTPAVTIDHSVLGGGLRKSARLENHGSQGRSLVKAEWLASGWSVWKYFLYAEIQSVDISCWAVARLTFRSQTSSCRRSSSASF